MNSLLSAHPKSEGVWAFCRLTTNQGSSSDFQRLGAHAVNIARRVAYLAGGGRG
jgi:hypothetical protein